MENKDQLKQLSESHYDCLLFDVDDTLYPISSGLSREVTKFIQEYMKERLGIEDDKVADMCLSLYRSHGTTMAGLRISEFGIGDDVKTIVRIGPGPDTATGYDFKSDDFNSYIYSRLPYNLLKPDLVLRSLLLSLPLRKIIFSNADKVHVNRVLHRLGLEDCFEEVICYENLNPIDSPTNLVVCKPFEEAFEKVFEIANINPRRTLFFDDNVLNLQKGKSFGLKTVRVGTSQRSMGVDHALESIHNIREALPELWQFEEKSEIVECSRKVSIETSVIA